MTLNQQLLLGSAASAVLILFGGTLGYLGTGEYLNGIIGKGALMTILAVGTLLGTCLSLGIGYLISRRVGTAIGGSIAGLSDNTAQVAAASSQVASASQSLAEGASVAASAIEETSSSLEEMSSMIKKALENSGQMTKSGDITFTAMKNSHKSLRETDAWPRPHTGLFTDFVPKLKERGMSDAQIQQFLVDNPREYFKAAHALKQGA